MISTMEEEEAKVATIGITAFSVFVAIVTVLTALTFVYLGDVKEEAKPSPQLMTVRLYYYNEKSDPGGACSPEAVQPVIRQIVITKTPVQDTINLLLKGNVTDAERQNGFSPMFPLEGVELKGANLRDGILTLEFKDPLRKTGGGSCRVRVLWAQIEKTSRQFEEVKEVRFIPDWLFQP